MHSESSVAFLRSPFRIEYDELHRSAQIYFRLCRLHSYPHTWLYKSLDRYEYEYVFVFLDREHRDPFLFLSMKHKTSSVFLWFHTNILPHWFQSKAVDRQKTLENNQVSDFGSSGGVRLSPRFQISYFQLPQKEFRLCSTQYRGEYFLVSHSQEPPPLCGSYYFVDFGNL